MVTFTEEMLNEKLHFLYNEFDEHLAEVCWEANKKTRKLSALVRITKYLYLDKINNMFKAFLILDSNISLQSTKISHRPIWWLIGLI